MHRDPVTRRRGAGLSALGFIALLACAPDSEPLPVLAIEPVDRPVETPMDQYVTSNTCRGCHPHHDATWRDSYHRSMTRLATPESVLGDFDDVVLTSAGRSWKLQHRGNDYIVEMDQPRWDADRGPAPRIERRVALVTGSHHQQAYWFPSGESRKLALLRFFWNLRDQRWAPIEAAFIMPPDERIPTETGAWNGVCSNCHATNPKPRVNGPNDMDTLVSEFGIACEACHGPAEEHVAANRPPQRRYQQHLAAAGDPTITNPARLSPVRASQVCGQCHGITRAYTDLYTDESVVALGKSLAPYRPGDELTDSRRVFEDGEEYFWSDGMVRVSGREYNGLIRSPCFEHGSEDAGVLSCLSCHQLHQRPDDPRPRSEWSNDQLAPGMRTNAACVSCHERFDAPEAVVAHTHHEVDSSGSTCANCHMPYTTYGLLKAIRSHEIDSPSVAASLETGRPNACNQCHIDRSLGWAAEHLEARYGAAAPALGADEQNVAASLLWALRGDAGQRALMALSFGWRPAMDAGGGAWTTPILAQLMKDPYPTVRAIAYRSLRKREAYADVAFDYVADASERNAVADRIRESWAGAPGAPNSVLIDASGGLSEAEFARQLAARDDRPMALNE